MLGLGPSAPSALSSIRCRSWSCRAKSARRLAHERLQSRGGPCFEKQAAHAMPSWFHSLANVRVLVCPPTPRSRTCSRTRETSCSRPMAISGPAAAFRSSRGFFQRCKRKSSRAEATHGRSESFEVGSTACAIFDERPRLAGRGRSSRGGTFVRTSLCSERAAHAAPPRRNPSRHAGLFLSFKVRRRPCERT